MEIRNISVAIDLMECTQSTNVINCPFEHLETLFTAHIGYGPVVKDAFPPLVFQLMQKGWNERIVPKIQNEPEWLKNENEQRLCELEAQWKEDDPRECTKWCDPPTTRPPHHQLPERTVSFPVSAMCFANNSSATSPTA